MSIDLDAYFRRIGYEGERKPTLAVLRELHRLHPQAIAFENLDPLLRRPVPLDLASLEAKLVTAGRGGYCFEQNLLFGHVLRALGFAVREATARVRWRLPAGTVTPLVHALLVVQCDDEDYLADVGFGGNVLTAPLRLASREPQETPHERCRLVSVGEHLTIEAEIAGSWQPLFVTDLAESHPVDFELGNWFTSAHPSSKFVTGLVAARVDPDRRCGLVDNRLAIHRLNGESERQTLGSASALYEALTDVFRLRLDRSPELDKMLARLCSGAES